MSCLRRARPVSPSSPSSLRRSTRRRPEHPPRMSGRPLARVLEGPLAEQRRRRRRVAHRQPARAARQARPHRRVSRVTATPPPPAAATTRASRPSTRPAALLALSLPNQPTRLCLCPRSLHVQLYLVTRKKERRVTSGQEEPRVGHTRAHPDPTRQAQSRTPPSCPTVSINQDQPYRPAPSVSVTYIVVRAAPPHAELRTACRVSER